MKSYPFAESSQIDKIEYDEKQQLLRITFKNGTVYEYEDVLESKVEAMSKAESAGKYFHKHIIKQYVTYKIDGKQRIKVS